MEAAQSAETVIVRQWSFFIPGHWPLYSEIRTIHGGQRIKKQWQEKAALYAKMAKVGPCDSIYLRYRHYRRDQRCDKSNLAGAAMKIVEDALVQVHVIADDRWNYITGFAHDFSLDANEGLHVFVIDQGKRPQ